MLLAPRDRIAGYSDLPRSFNLTGEMGMKRLLVDKPETLRVAYLDDIGDSVPIFAKRNGKLAGMLVYDDTVEKKGWILRIGGQLGSFGRKDTLKECIEYGEFKFGYEFFIED
jgi:hypothetical protein